MDKKLYVAETFKMDYNTDTSVIRKDYSVFNNCCLTGFAHICNFIVYEDNGKYREFLSDVEIPVMEEKIYKNHCQTKGYHNDQKASYEYNLKGDFPVFFILNKFDELNESNFTSLAEANQEYLEYYINFVKKTYGDNGGYKDNWRNQLQKMMIDELIIYGETVEENGYSDEYSSKYKVLKKEN